MADYAIVLDVIVLVSLTKLQNLSCAYDTFEAEPNPTAQALDLR
jgi:hypothetical protein